MAKIHPLPTCPRCGSPMRLARVVPRAFGHPELRSYACTVCREAVTEAVDEPAAQAGLR